MNFHIRLEVQDSLQTVHLEKRISLSYEPEPHFNALIKSDEDFKYCGVSQIS
jgi:hypothetical protein